MPFPTDGRLRRKRIETEILDACFPRETRFTPPITHQSASNTTTASSPGRRSRASAGNCTLYFMVIALVKPSGSSRFCVRRRFWTESPTHRGGTSPASRRPIRQKPHLFRLDRPPPLGKRVDAYQGHRRILDFLQFLVEKSDMATVAARTSMRTQKSAPSSRAQDLASPIRPIRRQKAAILGFCPYR